MQGKREEGWVILKPNPDKQPPSRAPGLGRWDHPDTLTQAYTWMCHYKVLLRIGSC